MAEAKITVQVGVEPTVQRTLKEFAEELSKKYGILLEHVYFEWRDARVLSSHRYDIDSMYVESKYVPTMDRTHDKQSESDGS